MMQTARGRADYTFPATPTFTITIVTSTSFSSPHSSSGSSTSFSKGLIVVFAFLILLMSVGGCFLFRSGGVTKDDEQWDEQISAAKRRWQRLAERLTKNPRQYPTLKESTEENEQRELAGEYVVSRLCEEECADDEQTDDNHNDSDSVGGSTNETENVDDSLSEKYSKLSGVDNISADIPIQSKSRSDKSGEHTKSPTPPPKISSHPLERQEGYYYLPVAPSHSSGIYNGYSYVLNYDNGLPSQNDAYAQQHYVYDRGGTGTGNYNGHVNGYMANNNNMVPLYGNTGGYGYYQPLHIPPQYYPYQRAYI
ncbi:uncharacterized protein V1513DRAFT_448984 [Lipomyces chichibuensis]|uniref:uncharacterized protein n=1 Tax=Lipomyces chichibuensis TaxID=1546026 RepID=UPI00334351AE